MSGQCGLSVMYLESCVLEFITHGDRVGPGSMHPWLFKQFFSWASAAGGMPLKTGLCPFSGEVSTLAGSIVDLVILNT